jgi:hypothetical protein
VIGGIANLIETIAGVATSFWGSRGGGSSQALAGCGVYV